ncbi:MAG: right-handed parallel beta-helix repeat-containing protein [Deltaproteobacteria bacterium]|nr:right-handed parallel beta-helix repeat-containing protein [Deltaproteobacteria bacterium]
MKLFFDEVAKEQQTKTLYTKNRSWLGKKVDAFKTSIFSVAGILYGSSVTARDLDAEEQQEQKERPQAQTPTQAQPNAQPDTSKANQPAAALDSSQAQPKPEISKTPDVIVPTLQETKTPVLLPISDGSRQGETRAPTLPALHAPVAATRPEQTATFVTAQKNPSPPRTPPMMFLSGGGGIPSPPPTPTPTPSSGQPVDTTPPNSPTISSPAGETFIASTTSIVFTGTAEAGAGISQTISRTTATTTAAGTWSLTVNGFNQGTTTISFIAADSANNHSSSTSKTVVVDSVAPIASFTVSECGASLATSSCLIATTTVTMTWSTGDADVSFFTLSCTEIATSAADQPCAGFINATTTATTSGYTALPRDGTYLFTLQATDQYGNVSTLQAKTVVMALRPVVINEIAWAGTSASRSEDEWLELYNTTDYDIPLTNWVLRSTDNMPYIPLSGTIARNSFFVLERTNNTTITDIVANQIYTGGLGNSGEILELSYASTTMDKTPAPCGSAWCSGTATSDYRTMERYDPTASGEDATNWQSWQEFLGNGSNADNQPIHGTPARRNSAHYMIDRSGTTLAANKTLTKSNSPYIVSRAFGLNAGVTLTLHPGVVIKFVASTSLNVSSGVLQALGSTADPIVFTSLRDDTHAGDTNQDAASTTPSPGDWGALAIAGNGSVIDNAIIRYGGWRDQAGSFVANVRVRNASATISNATIEWSDAHGIYMDSASGQISSNIIRDNNAHDDTGSDGVYVFRSSPAIQNNTFLRNTRGIQFNEGSGTVSNNTFTSHTHEAVLCPAGCAAFSGNTATGNEINGIVLNGTMISNYTAAGDMPYVISPGLSVEQGFLLTLNAGAVVKFQDSATLSISGTLVASGTQALPVVFTSLHDDDCGIAGGCGNTDNATTTPLHGIWRNMFFRPESVGSTLNYAVIRYGGDNSQSSTARGAIRTLNAPLAISNATLEQNYYAGMVFNGVGTTSLAGSLIQNHQQGPADLSYGLVLNSGATTTVATTHFKNNRTLHINADATSLYINGDGNVFE